MSNKSRIGRAPGEVIFTGNKKVESIKIHYLSYSEASYEDQEFDNHSQVLVRPDADNVVWTDVRGLHDEELITAMGKCYNIHPLVVADIIDIHKKSSFTELPEGIFVTLKSLTYEKVKNEVKSEHISLFFTSDFLLSFQEDHTDVFSLVRKRVITKNGIVRNRKADYLAFALIDDILDHNFLVLESLQSRIEELEEDLINDVHANTRQHIHYLKKETLKLQKHLSPLRETLSRFSRSESKFLDQKNRIYFRDLHDMVIQLLDRVGNQRDYLNGLQDLLISEISNKMNEVMKTLTIITTIFVPLSFLVGLYGMNFENIPELKFRNGYFVLLSVMALLVSCLLIYFKKKKWL